MFLSYFYPEAKGYFDTEVMFHSYFCFEVRGDFDTEVLFLSYFCFEVRGCFDTAVSTIFWHAPKYGKNAPTQRGRDGKAV